MTTPELIAHVNDLLFIEPAPVRVVVWRIVSKDPDEYIEYKGLLTDETAECYYVRLDSEPVSMPFPKRTPSGVTLWRLDFPKAQS